MFATPFLFPDLTNRGQLTWRIVSTVVKFQILSWQNGCLTGGPLWSSPFVHKRLTSVAQPCWLAEACEVLLLLLLLLHLIAAQMEQL